MKNYEVEISKPKLVVLELDSDNLTKLVAELGNQFIQLDNKYCHSTVKHQSKFSALKLKSELKYTQDTQSGFLRLKFMDKVLIDYPNEPLPKYLLFIIKDNDLLTVKPLANLDGYQIKE